MLVQILGAVALFLAVVAAWLFSRIINLQAQIVELNGKLADVKALRPQKSTKEQPSKAAEAVDTSALDKEIEEARNELKELKKQLYDVKQDNKDLKKQIEQHEDAKPTPVNSDVVFSLREEIGELKGEVARLEQDASDAKKARRKAPEPEPAPKAAPAPKAQPEVAGDSDESISALRSQMQRELAEARTEAQKEIADLEGRLKKTASNVDKQRRRADNNDRAYKITQRQLDAAQERIELLESQRKKASFTSQADDAGQVASDEERDPVAPKSAPDKSAPDKSEPDRSEPAAAAAIVKRKSDRAVEREKVRSEASAADEAPVGSRTAILSSGAFALEDADEPEAAQAAPPAQPEPEPKPEPKPEPAAPAVAVAAAVAAAAAAAEAAPADTGSTVKSKPIASDEAVKAVTPSANAPADESDESESATGGSTQILSSAALRAMATPEDSSAVTAEMPRVLEAAGVADAGREDADSTGATPGLSLEEPSADGKRSTGLFGIPDDVLNADPDEDSDPTRSTQFAFPAAQTGEGDEASNEFQRESSGVLSGARLRSFAVEEGENPAEEPTPDVSGGGPGTAGKRLGETSSAVDDAWADLDFD